MSLLGMGSGGLGSASSPTGAATSGLTLSVNNSSGISTTTWLIIAAVALGGMILFFLHGRH